MKNEMMKNEMNSVGTQRLCLPLQTGPVNRTLIASALSGQDGVVPSFDWGKLASIVGQALPGIVSLF